METQKLTLDKAVIPILDSPMTMTLENKAKRLNALLERMTFRARVADAFDILPESGFPLQISVEGDPRIAQLTLITRKKLEEGEPLSGKDFWYSITPQF